MSFCQPPVATFAAFYHTAEKGYRRMGLFMFSDDNNTNIPGFGANFFLLIYCLISQIEGNLPSPGEWTIFNNYNETLYQPIAYAQQVDDGKSFFNFKRKLKCVEIHIGSLLHKNKWHINKKK